MLGFLKRGVVKVLEKLAERTATQVLQQFAVDELAERIAFDTTLELLLHTAPRHTPREVFRNVSDEFWFWAHTDGYRRKAKLRELLPGLPSTEVQTTFTGLSDQATLQEAFATYRTFKQLYEQHAGRELTQGAAVLDYGCGWGRIIRFFLKDLEPAGLVGADPDADMIDLCEQTNPWCRFQRIDFVPPSPFPDDTFDLVYAFSVFSHLSEAYHQAVLREVRRILKPGGLLLATTHPRDFITFCAEFRAQVNPRTVPLGVANSLGSFPDPQKTLDDYDAGRYCFSPFERVDEAGYEWGDAAISEAYARRHWADGFTFLDYVNDRQRCSQNVIVVRKQ